MPTLITNRRIEDRWTPSIIQAGGFTPISVFFLDNYSRLPVPIKSTEAILVIHLIRHKMDERAPFPSLALLASRMGLKVSAVRERMRSLEQKGYVARESRVARSNVYRLDGLFRALEALIKYDEQKNAAEPRAKTIEKGRDLNPGASSHVERVRDTSGGSRDKWRKASPGTTGGHTTSEGPTDGHTTI
jgi:DNA-binding Lrp family transcriptional regulator